MTRSIFIEEFNIENYKLFYDLQVKELNRVNLITGKNNVGKTSLIESIFLALGPTNPALWAKISSWRGLDRVSPKQSTVPYFFPKLNTSHPITFNVSASGNFHYKVQMRFGESTTLQSSASKNQSRKVSSQETVSIEDLEETRSVQLSYIPNKGKRRDSIATITRGEVEFTGAKELPFAESIFIRPGLNTKEISNPERYTRLNKKDRIPEFEKHLKFVEPNLLRTGLGVENDETMIMGDVGYGLVPLSLLGSGMFRLTTILLSIANYPNAVVLIDEIEYGFHHTIFEKVWHAIAEFAAEYNTQIIATTHNDECIATAHKVFKDRGLYDFHLHRLVRRQERTEIFGFDREQIEASLESGWELR